MHVSSCQQSMHSNTFSVHSSPSTPPRHQHISAFDSSSCDSTPNLRDHVDHVTSTIIGKKNLWAWAQIVIINDKIISIIAEATGYSNLKLYYCRYNLWTVQFLWIRYQHLPWWKKWCDNSCTGKTTKKWLKHPLHLGQWPKVWVFPKNYWSRICGWTQSRTSDEWSCYKTFQQDVLWFWNCQKFPRGHTKTATIIVKSQLRTSGWYGYRVCDMSVVAKGPCRCLQDGAKGSWWTGQLHNHFTCK